MTRSAPPTVLLTGATGFLGSALAVDLLQRGLKPLFLVRAADAVTARRRLDESISRMGAGAPLRTLLDDDMMLCGDLGDFAGRHAGDSRLACVTHVINCAALASFAWKPEVWDVNVNHTTTFAQSAARLPHLQRFLHVGTAMICGDTRNTIVHEDDFPSDGSRQFVPYTRSKAEMERRLPEIFGDARLVVARPSIVVGHTQLGCAPSPSIFWVFRMIHAARLIPFAPTNAVDIIPVDYCAQALVHLALKPQLTHARYHVAAGPQLSCSFADIDRSYSRAEGQPERELEEFDPKDLSADDPRWLEWFEGCDPRLMTSAVRVYRAFAGLDVSFDTSRLHGEGFPPPPAFTDYLATCVASGERESVAQQMIYDFR